MQRICETFFKWLNLIFRGHPNNFEDRVLANFPELQMNFLKKQFHAVFRKSWQKI